MSANIENNTKAVLERIASYRQFLAQDDAAMLADLDAFVTEEGWDPTALRQQAALPEPDMDAVATMVLAHAAAQG